MAKVGAVVRRGEDYGVVIAVSDTDFSAARSSGPTAPWVTVSEVEWVDSREWTRQVDVLGFPPKVP